jgi:hypothetical protein
MPTALLHKFGCPRENWLNTTGGVRGEARIVERAFGICARALAEAVAVIGEGLNLQIL